MKKRAILALLLLIQVLILSFPVVANAQFNSVCNDKYINAGNASSSAICKDNSTTNPFTSAGTGIVDEITNIIAIAAGVAAVIMLIIGGLQFITSSGDSQKVSSAKNTIMYALIGIVVIALARTIIVYVVSKIQ